MCALLLHEELFEFFVYLQLVDYSGTPPSTHMPGLPTGSIFLWSMAGLPHPG